MNMLFSSAQGMAKGKIVLTGEIKVNIQAGKLSYQIHMSAFKKEKRKATIGRAASPSTHARVHDASTTTKVTV